MRKIVLKIMLLGAVSLCCQLATAEPATKIDFTRQIRPILSNKCFLCHGPDESSREAELRLDQRESAVHDRGDYAAIVAGNAEKSELLARVISSDESLVMPPPETKKSLTTEEIALLRRWIEEGAHYDKHWAFVSPVRNALPELSETAKSWALNPIDHFIAAKLEQNGFSPSPQADRVTLLRRLHLDITGLPPTIPETDQFLANTSKQAYAEVVKNLIASPHYGERQARHWLDAARYADSDGYEKDMQRSAWFWRDWVINAFNRDLPYDDFIIQQIAGDLLSQATPENRIATGFLRNSMVNEEGGADPEQFRVEGIFDRVDAIGKAILGLTTQCAQCHSHKYDPLTHHDYYGMFAFLNNSEEANMIVYTQEQQRNHDRIQNGVQEIETGLQAEMLDWREQLGHWAELQQGNQPEWTVLRPTKLPFTGTKFALLEDNSILSESYAPPKASPEFGFETTETGIGGIRLEALMHPQLPGGGPGRSVYGSGAVTEIKAFIQPMDGSHSRREIKLIAATSDVNEPERKIGPRFYKIKEKEGDDRVTGPIEYAIDGNVKTAWTTDSGPASRHQPRKAVFVPEKPFGFAGGTRLTIQLNQSHGGWDGNLRHNCLLGRTRIAITTQVAPIADPLPAALRELIETKSPQNWTDAEIAHAFSYWRTTQSQWAKANEAIEELLSGSPSADIQLVAMERAKPRITHRMLRGDFLSPAEVIEPHTPDFLHAFPDDAPRNRLGFAKWLVSRDAPTTARTIVNRVWQSYFGIGLVETPEDLGFQSPAPSHPDLLDWLAVEFMESDWSFKHLHQLIVTSATYRQSSHLSPQLFDRDPLNRLLARSPRLRVDAEIVRDIALTASGLLNRRVGGRSVYPTAPMFIFLPPASYGDKHWHTEQDDQLYRRSLYVHAYRSVPYPPLQVFDAPRGDAACVRRTRSNTPLQALTLLNETQFVECSRALAQRISTANSTEQGADSERLRHAFRLCLTREPAPPELKVLTVLLQKSRARFAEQPEQAAKLLGLEENREESSELAAWTIVCRALLNLDETITKQ